MATTSELLDEAKCIDCAIPDGMKLSVLISLFASIAGVSADPNTLMANAACIDCAIPPGMQMAVLISLAEDISGGGGTGGTGCALPTNGDPEGVLTATCSPAIAVDPATQAIYLFTGVAGTNTGWALKV